MLERKAPACAVLANLTVARLAECDKVVVALEVEPREQLRRLS